MVSLSSRFSIVRLTIAGAFGLSFLWLFHRGFGGQSFSSLPHFALGGEVPSTNPLKLQSVPLAHKNVVVASVFGAHFDVYMAVVWTLQRIMAKDQGSNLQVYAKVPFLYKFQEVVNRYGLYGGEFKDPKHLIGDIKRDDEGGIDLLVLGTCEIDMPHWNEELLIAWDARDASHKFQIVCIVHNVGDVKWQAAIPEWSRRNAIRLLSISEHVARTFRRKFQSAARNSDIRLSSAGYEHIPVDFHIPILNIQSASALPPNRVLSNVVIQGSFLMGRRDYARIFSQLNASLYDDPESWGYTRLEVNGKNSTFISLPDTTPDRSPPFQLHLVGHGKLEIPPALKNIVVLHVDLEYTEFYALMSGMDVCVPAFARNSDTNYVNQASSTVAMCMENNVPILGVRELRESYTHIDDDSITITRPAAMSEMQAIKALRTGDASTFLDHDPTNSGFRLGDHPGIRKAVEDMMKRGWVKTIDGFEERKRKTWEKNDVVMMRILRDM